MVDHPLFLGRMMWVDASRLAGWKDQPSFYDPLPLDLTEADQFILKQIGAGLAGMDARRLYLPVEWHTLKTERDILFQRRADITTRMHELRLEAIEVAGWKRCCRCFPRLVDDDGFCGCCLYNHVTGVQTDGDVGEDA